MSREWKSGDVILHPDGLLGLVVETGAGCANHFKHGDLHVHYKDGDWDALVPDDARPLVVIDPENREQVERLAKCYRDVHGEAEFTDEPWSVHGLRMQAALREFANPKPPKPEEPTGLGAVVEVESQFFPGEKRRLVRTHNTSKPWFGDSTSQAWDEIPGAVKVLSDGIPA